VARFDVLALRTGALVLDCQADLLSDLRTRFVVPLFPIADAPFASDRLNPTLGLSDGQYVMGTQGAATVDVREIAKVVASVPHAETAIMNALDLLLTGY
jgi:toxin CcdB